MVLIFRGITFKSYYYICVLLGITEHSLAVSYDVTGAYYRMRMRVLFVSNDPGNVYTDITKNDMRI